MERKIIFKKSLNERIGLKELKTDFVRIINDKIIFNANVQIEYIYNKSTTICIITFIQDSSPILEDKIIKKFRGVAKLYFPDIYDKKVGEDNAREKAIIKVNKYFFTVRYGYIRLLKKFIEKNNVEEIIIKAFERKGKKKKEGIE